MLVDYNGFDFYLRGISLKFAVGILIMQLEIICGNNCLRCLKSSRFFSGKIVCPKETLKGEKK